MKRFGFKTENGKIVIGEKFILDSDNKYDISDNNAKKEELSEYIREIEELLQKIKTIIEGDLK